MRKSDTLKRAEREGFEAAQAILAPLGIRCSQERGGKHLMVVAHLDSGDIKVPIAGSPAHGPKGGANLVGWTLRKALRMRGVAVGEKPAPDGGREGG